MEQHIIDNLKSLKTLLDSGVLSADEFEEEKKKILSERNNIAAPIQESTTPQVQIEESKEPIKSHTASISNYGEKALLCWALIYVITGIFRELIIFGNNLWFEDSSLKTIYFLLNIVDCVGCFLPALSIKEKKYRIICVIGIGLLTLYFIFQNLRNMMSY